MIAADVLPYLAALQADQRDGETLASEATREGIAYDEIHRFMLIGPALVAAGIGAWCETDEEGEPLPDLVAAKLLHGRLWLDGFFTGRRMGRAETEAEIERHVSDRLDGMLEDLLRALLGLGPDDVPRSDRPEG